MASETAPNSKKMLWAGRIVSAVPVFMLLMSAVMKLMRSPQAVEGFKAMGYPDAALIGIGVAEAICAVLYAIPQTAVLGAILVTGYLGGATDVHVRTSQPLYVPVLLGMIAWLGLFLRDARLRALLPLRR